MSRDQKKGEFKTKGTAWEKAEVWKKHREFDCILKKGTSSSLIFWDVKQND